MKVFISVDAEGVTGIVNIMQVLSNKPDYEFCRRMMTEDANAAVKGAFNAGATKVVINDSHNRGNNLFIDKLDPRIELISGFDKRYSMMEGIDRGFDAALFIGYHSKSGYKGVISHTYFYQKIVQVTINNKPVSEYELNGLFAGYFNIPVVFISGDSELTSDAQSNIPGVYVTTTKEAIGHSSALCYHPEVTRKSIIENVEKSLKNLKTDNIKPMSLGTDKIDLKIQFSDYSSAEYASWIPGIKRIGPSTVGVEANNYFDVFKAFKAAITISLANNVLE